MPGLMPIFFDLSVSVAEYLSGEFVSCGKSQRHAIDDGFLFCLSHFLPFIDMASDCFNAIFWGQPAPDSVSEIGITLAADFNSLFNNCSHTAITFLIRPVR